MATGGIMDSSDDEEEIFRMRRPSLMEQLQNILREYPKDFQIIHELVQNAEDAGASVLKIKYRTGQDKTESDSYYSKFFTSPALCVYNDGVFDKDDWMGIISVCLSHKEQKTNKIGRYGQGFKSVFHLTDFPVIISGTFVLMIDPFRVDRECTRRKISEMNAILKNAGVFEMFDINLNNVCSSTFMGTLFWFPLRLIASSLSETIWDTTKITNILKSYEEEAPLVLIFLKSLAKIEVFHEYGSNFAESSMTTANRKSIGALLGYGERGTITQDRYSYIKTDIWNGRKRIKLAIVHYHAGKGSVTKELARLVDDKEIGCLPYVGVAFQYGQTSNNGRIFNFLPLPSTNYSGLPIHVNGYFALSQNRRTLKLAGYGTSYDKFVQWNELLVKEVVTKAYTKLIENLIHDSVRNNNPPNSIKMVYASLPQNESRSLPLWSTLVKSLFSNIRDFPVFFTKVSGGKWVDKEHAMLIHFTSLHEIDDEDDGQRYNVQETIRKLVLALDKALFEERKNTQLLIGKSHIKTLTSTDVANFIRQSPRILQKFTRQETIAILRYFLADRHTNIEDLQLLPLANSNFGKFSKLRGTKTYIATEEEIKLFPGKEATFVAVDLPDDVYRGLNDIGLKGGYELRHLKQSDVPGLLKEVFDMYSRQEGERYIPNCPNSPLTITWMKSLLTQIQKENDHNENKYALFENLPIIPQYRHGNEKIDSFYILKGDNVLSSYEKYGITKLPQNVLDILTKYGVTVLDCNEIILHSDIIKRYVELPIFNCIERFWKNNQGFRQKIQQCTGLRRGVWFSQGTSAMSFGQREELVTRLRGILTSYPQDDSVLKEMIQNADDAGASEIHFLLDMRTHKTERTFDEQWNPLQGPALCVYNDGIFTQSDLEGLQRLGTGSKCEDRTKTGQFGIGFNSVYHLTDAPCIFAHGPNTAKGGFFCVFDPHCRYAPLAHFGDPGMVMESHELITNHQDVFDTFLSRTELQRKHGTWFRLPLRRLDNWKSEISSKTYENEDMLLILDRMKTNVEDSLLFLLNLKKIKISYITEDANHLNLCETVALCNDNAIQQQAMSKCHLKRLNENLRNSPTSVLYDNITEYKYTFTITVNGKITSNWFVIQSLGMSESTSVDFDIQHAFQSQEIRFLPRGGIAVLLDRILACSKAFCLLPLPIETGMSCHINGQFAVDISRHKLWGSDQSKHIHDVRGKWNMDLLKRNIAHAYASVVFYFRDKLNDKRRNDMFPLFEKAENNFWRFLIFHIYLQIKKRSLKVFQLSTCSTLGHVSWVAHLSMDGNPLLVDKLNDKNLRRIFLAMGMRLIVLPFRIQNSICTACKTITVRHEQMSSNCICIQSVDPSSVVKLLSSRGVRNMNLLSGRIEDVRLCLEYCLNVNDAKELIGLPLLLRNDGIFICLEQQNDLILSEFSDLLPTSKDQFVHSAVTDLFASSDLAFKELTGSVFKQLLQKLVNVVEYKTYSLVLLREDLYLTIEWLKRFWSFVDKTTNSFKELEDWNLFPTAFGETIYLSPIKWSKQCIDLESFERGVHRNVAKVMKRLRLPVPVVSSEKLSNSLVKYENVSGVIDCIHFWKNLLSKNMQTLSEEECVRFFEYLMTEKHLSKEAKLKLKEIPLFISVNGHHVNLSCSEYFAVQHISNAPLSSLQPLFDQLNLTALKYFPEIHYLYDISGCKIINMANLYKWYVLPSFNLVDKSYHLEHMCYIRDNLMLNWDMESAMRTVSFLPLGGILKQANHFYNPDHPLFGEFSSDIDFPPAPYNNKSWRSFLIRAGLKNDVDEDIFLELARSVAKLSCTEEVTQKSELLFEYLTEFTRRQGNITTDFIRDISNVRFIPVCQLDEELTQICEPAVKCKGMHSLGILFIYEQRYLVWTSAYVLPPSATACLKQMKLHKTPDFDTVKIHIKNICTALQRSCIKHDQLVVEKIITEIYGFLRSHMLQLNELGGIPLIHIPTHFLFAFPQQVFKNIKNNDEIIPYLLKAPEIYGAFYDIFEAMGMQKEATTVSYCKVFDQLHVNCSDSSLSPPELELTRKTLFGFMKTLQDAEKPFEDLGVETLYLLSETGSLLPSETLYYDSLETPRSRLTNNEIKFLADFDCIGINVSQLHDMFSLLPEKYRPKSIQNIVGEEISFMLLDECETVGRLKEILTSTKFTNVILRICQYDQRRLKRDFSIGDMRNIAAKLRRLRVYGVSLMETALQLNGRTVQGTESVKTCFYNDENEVLYVNGNNIDIDRWLQKYYIELERCLQIIAYGKYCRHTLLSVLPSFSVQYDCIEDTLTQFGIPSLEGDIASDVWHPPAGSLVPMVLKPYLRKAFRPLKIKSYAVMVHDEGLSENNIDLEYILNEDVTLIYVIITDILEDTYGEITGYKVNVGKDIDIKVDKGRILEIQPRTNESNCFEKYLQNPLESGSVLADTVDGRNVDNIFTATHYHPRLPNPQKRQGLVWFKQAELDLQSGKILMEGLYRDPTQCYNWVCHQAQQAAEKATKGAQYAVDAFSFQRDHYLLANVPDKDDTLRAFASKLQGIIGHINGLRYPDYMRLPAERYSKENAEEALQLAERIVHHVNDTYFYDY